MLIAVIAMAGMVIVRHDSKLDAVLAQVRDASVQQLLYSATVGNSLCEMRRF